MHRVPEPTAPVVHALGFSWRKRPLVRQFLGGSKIRFIRSSAQVPNGGTLAVWASGPFGSTLADAGQSPRFKKLFIEDGFLRSVGLGADLVRPLSWVIDCRGIHYDASRPNDLEHLLQTFVFDGATLARAAALRNDLVSSGLTKYNVGTRLWQRPAQAGHKPVVLVPGQVETDASIRYGAPGINTNLDLLKAVRAAHPLAWLLYKPHPDVLAGLRGKGEQEDQAGRWCDEVVGDVAMGALLGAVDSVHVMTSLAGFEALLRGKTVVCHGLPFYAGWGLTQDVLQASRRSRKLAIDELVAGALLLYPTYISRVTGHVCQPEQTLAELAVWQSSAPVSLPFWRKIVRLLIRRP